MADVTQSVIPEEVLAVIEEETPKNPEKVAEVSTKVEEKVNEASGKDKKKKKSSDAAAGKAKKKKSKESKSGDTEVHITADSVLGKIHISNKSSASNESTGLAVRSVREEDTSISTQASSAAVTTADNKKQSENPVKSFSSSAISSSAAAVIYSEVEDSSILPGGARPTPANYPTPAVCLDHPPEEYYTEFLETQQKEKLNQLWPQHWGSFGDHPERDSLDGNLPGSYGVNPSPSAPAGTSDFPQITSVLVKKHFDELRKKTAKDKDKDKEKDKEKIKDNQNKTSKAEKKMDLLGFSRSNADKSAGDLKGLWNGDKKEPFTNLWVTLSAMYGKIAVITMLAFCLTEVMDNSIAPLTFQGVYMIYLYVGSILAIMCIYISLLIDQCPSLTRSRENLTASDPESGSMSSFDTLKRAHISRAKTPRTSFYLRVGALVFGLATLVFNGLEIAMHATMTGKCVADVIFAHPILQALFTFLQMHFLFVNSEVLVEKFGMVARFGFIHLVATNISIWIRMIVWESANEWLHYLHYQHTSAGIGSDVSQAQTLQLKGYPTYMAGMADYTYFDDEPPAAANSLDYISANDGSGAICNSSYTLVSEAHIRSMVSLYECFNNNTLGKMWTSSMPYLFPFLVEYKLKLELHFSLIAAAVAYIMWRSVGKAKKSAPSIRHKAGADCDTLDTRRPKGYWRVDCQSASKGLFLGLLCLVAGIIVLIIFFVMKDSSEFRTQLFWICTGTQVSIMVLTALASIIGFIQLPKLSVTNNKPLNLDVLLANITTYGVYIFAVFGLIVGGANIWDPKHLGVFLCSALLLVQVTLQSMFIAEATKRACSSRYQMLFKPGRQIVTFMLFANITLWLLDTFMTHNWLTQELQFSFYGFLAWGIISRISLPLVVFYRFHSAVVLIEIWKNTYRTKEP